MRWALRQVELGDPPTLPERLASVADSAASAADEFIEANVDNPVPGFVPSDFAACARALLAVRRGVLAPGLSFCEWGSGVGGVTVLASLAGFDAVGIEIDPGLVRRARALAHAAGAPGARFVEGSFVPEGADADSGVDSQDEILWLVPGGADAYEELGLGVDDFDVVFAYPWPGEERVVETLFLEHAAAGALLLTYHGIEGVRAARKVARRR